MTAPRLTEECKQGLRPSSPSGRCRGCRTEKRCGPTPRRGFSRSVGSLLERPGEGASAGQYRTTTAGTGQGALRRRKTAADVRRLPADHRCRLRQEVVEQPTKPVLQPSHCIARVAGKVERFVADPQLVDALRDGHLAVTSSAVGLLEQRLLQRHSPSANECTASARCPARRAPPRRRG